MPTDDEFLRAHVSSANPHPQYLATGGGTGTPSTTSAQLRAQITDETGTGQLVFADSPALINPTVGTQTAGDNSTKAASTAYADGAITDHEAEINPHPQYLGRFPFYDSSSVLDYIDLTPAVELPFFDSTGASDNIPMEF